MTRSMTTLSGQGRNTLMPAPSAMATNAKLSSFQNGRTIGKKKRTKSRMGIWAFMDLSSSLEVVTSGIDSLG